jgi:lantibiotic leader peptide-processing serine protease
MGTHVFGRLLLLVSAAAVALAFVGAAGAARYVILYKQHAVPDSAARSVAAAGGTLIAAYDGIGVAIARSDDPSFRDRLMRDGRVEGAASTEGFGVRVESVEAEGPPPGDLPNAPASDADTFSPLQWDMRQISAPQAHAVTGGSRAVLAGDIDTGADWRHPDLAPNIDFANSVSCEGGVPNQAPTAWDDDLGHGTHTAGTIAAAANGIGIVGVAPNVRLGIIDVSTPGGFFFPEAIVCGFVWAAEHGFDVTNNSYFADPFEYNCHNDPVQQAIWKAETRAIRYAIQSGVTVVASAGNSNVDLTRHPPAGNECVRIPSEVAGVITVSANGNLEQKSFYSNYGVAVIDLVAPGGDSRQLTPEAPNGRVLSTWPASLAATTFVLSDPAQPGAFYRYVQGTSMAAPHVTGTAALVISRFGDARTPQNGKLRPNQVESYLQQTADEIPCGPDPACYGGSGYNAFYGHGQVNALRAVTRDAGR